MTSQAQNQTRPARPDAAPMTLPRTQKLLAAGGVIGALATSSCCVVPLVLFGLGVSGAWIANLTQLAPYQPYTGLINCRPVRARDRNTGIEGAQFGRAANSKRHNRCRRSRQWSGKRSARDDCP